MDKSRKVIINVLSSKRSKEADAAHKKREVAGQTVQGQIERAISAEEERAHAELLAMQAEKRAIAHRSQTRTPSSPTKAAEAISTSRRPVPKKPLLVEGIEMSALSVAYFCMEIGLESAIPTYAGGLGILAGDMLKSCADLKIPVIGVSLLYRKGYFRQHLDDSGWQIEQDVTWEPAEKQLVELPHRTTLVLEGRKVVLRAWMYTLLGRRGGRVPVIFLDTDLPENSQEDRSITDRLYAGDHRHRILQEAVLGIGGLRMLEALGALNIQKYHMNEGHSGFLTVELYRQYAATDEPLEEVRKRAVFTTHTPIASGHDQFSRDEVEGVLGTTFVPHEIAHDVFKDGVVSMTRLGLDMTNYRNGVARRHGEITRELFPGYEIDAITNGVYAPGWVADNMASLFDRYLGEWRSDQANLRYALTLPLEELWSAHQVAKRNLLQYLKENHGAEFSEDALTIGFGRRMTGYKRGTMLISDLDRLRAIAERSERGIQLVYSGKAHPHDDDGKHIIQEIVQKLRGLGGKIRGVYVPDYSIEVARKMASGVDVWLNTPNRPQEASGTSGMKAAMNGIPHFSVLDGWWLEGHIEGITGWAIGPHPEKGPPKNAWDEDREDLYTKLEYLILPRYEKERDQWIRMMRQTIALNGSFFNTHRMVEQYVLNAYFK